MFNLCRKFQCDKICSRLVAAVIQYPYALHPAERIWIAREFSVVGLMHSALSTMMEIPLFEITEEHCRLMGWDIYRIVTRLKEASDIHRRIVACEPPKLTHRGDCLNPKLCEEHWRGTWWNGMGRFLMDGRTKLSFEEAVKRFVLMSFGEMNHNLSTTHSS